MGPGQAVVPRGCTFRETATGRFHAIFAIDFEYSRLSERTRPAARSSLLQASNMASGLQSEAPQEHRPGSLPEGWRSAIYALALAVALSTWFIEIRAPLWLDETVSMFLIKGGWAGILSRQVWPDAPAYSCLLWVWTKVMGTGELM